MSTPPAIDYTNKDYASLRQALLELAQLRLPEWSDRSPADLGMLLATRIGERPMQRDFGTKIPSLVHEPDDDALAALIESQAREAMLRWEPRLIVVSTAVERKEGELSLRLDYVHVDQVGGGQIVVSVA